MPAQHSHSTAPESVDPSQQTGIVIIGRNEGARLIACLESVSGADARIVYVDSGSTDTSVEEARKRGAQIIALDMDRPFTAARARNAGFAKLDETQNPAFIQFIDGDCTLSPGWLETATAFLGENAQAAIIVGEVRERHPEKSFFNRMIDREWRGPPGEIDACGGIAMIRARAFSETGGFTEALIAGEEPELCVRLREKGWSIHKIAAPMACHDADMTSLGKWLKRARRAGHAFAEVSTLHKGSDKRIWKRESHRALGWTGLGVALVLLGVLVHPFFWLGLIIYPLQILRMGARQRPLSLDHFRHAGLIMAQKPWEAAGVLQFWFNKATGRHARLIEYRKTKGGAHDPDR